VKWFGRKGAGVAGRPPLTRAWSNWSGAGASGDWPQDYGAQLRAAILANPVGQRCLRLVCEGVGSATIRAVTAERTDAAAALALVRERSAGQGLIETLASHLLLNGNGYVQIGHGADGRPVRLYALRPERVTVEADAQGWPVAYGYRAGEGSMRYTGEDGAGRTAIIHVKALNPADDHYGLGCLGAASGAVAIHNAATRWNKALLDNAARPSGALVHESPDGTALSPEQFDRLKAELEGAFQGAANAGRPMLLEGGLSWQALSLSPADMDFVGLKAAAARDIALAFGVPPALVGLPGDSTYANYREANRALWRQTILPIGDAILGALSQGLKDWFPGLELTIDMNRIPELVEERATLWEQVASADFLSPEEKRAMLGIEGDA
jgi:HK97 family phage portal protein